MVWSSGTAEGLRGLVDSPLLYSIRNEPTVPGIIQEVGVLKVFHRTVDAGLEPVIEVSQAMPNTIGALCLIQTDADQLAARPPDT